MYNKIRNPETNRQVNINSKLGRNILDNYVFEMRGGTPLQNAVDEVVKIPGMYHICTKAGMMTRRVSKSLKQQWDDKCCTYLNYQIGHQVGSLTECLDEITKKFRNRTCRCIFKWGHSYLGYVRTVSVIDVIITAVVMKLKKLDVSEVKFQGRSDHDDIVQWFRFAPRNPDDPFYFRYIDRSNEIYVITGPNLTSDSKTLRISYYGVQVSAHFEPDENPQCDNLACYFEVDDDVKHYIDLIFGMISHFWSEACEKSGDLVDFIKTRLGKPPTFHLLRDQLSSIPRHYRPPPIDLPMIRSRRD